jgi:hypothetical protein
MTAPLRDQLQRSLGDAVLLQRELGGGGMSRVFLARDEALGALDDRTGRDLGLGRDDVGALARRRDARGADRPRAQRAQSSWIT